MKVSIITNPHLANQRECAQWLQQGFQRHGITADITADKHAVADVVVIQGPWYAYREWVGKPNVLFLNRCFYGDARFDVSLGWLRCDGSRDFRNDAAAVPNGTLPMLKDAKEGRRCCIVFKDFNRNCDDQLQDARRRFDSVFGKRHPSDQHAMPVLELHDLESCWQLGDVAIGHSSSVLCEALINGLVVESTDPQHVVHDCDGDRQAWLTRLSWAQWHYDKICDGSFWEHLC